MTVTAQRRILLIEDDHDSREMLRMLLELDGHTVVVAEGGRVGIETAAATRPDIALIDIGLPDVDGYEVARRIRNDVKSVRLIALTGYDQPKDRLRAVEAGFDAHIVKPIDPSDLQRLIADG